MNNTYSKAVSLGYPFIRGRPKRIRGGLANRFQKTEEQEYPAIYVRGPFQPNEFAGKKWIVMLERGPDVLEQLE